MDIRKLVEKYMEGETSLKEEQKLRNYFANTPIEKIPLDLRDLAPMFEYFSEQREDSVKLKFHSPTFLIATISFAAVLALGIVFSNHHFRENDSTIKLVINGERVYDDSLARDIVDKNFKILRKGILRAENSLQPMNKLEDSFSKVKSLASNLNYEEE